MAELRTGEITCEGCRYRNPSSVRFCAGCGRLLRRPEVQAKARTAQRREAQPSRGLPSWLSSLTTHLLSLLAGLAIGFLLAQWIDLPTLF